MKWNNNVALVKESSIFSHYGIVWVCWGHLKAFSLLLCIEGQHPGVDSSLLAFKPGFSRYYLMKLPNEDLWDVCFLRPETLMYFLLLRAHFTFYSGYCLFWSLQGVHKYSIENHPAKIVIYHINNVMSISDQFSFILIEKKSDSKLWSRSVYIDAHTHTHIQETAKHINECSFPSDVMTMLDSHLSACTPSSSFSVFVHLILPPPLWLQPHHTWLGSNTAMKGLLWTMSSIPKPYKYLSSLLYIVREEGTETEMGRCYFSKQKGLMCADGIRATGILTQCVERRREVNLDLTLSQEPSQYLTVSWLWCVWSCQRTALHFTWIKKKRKKNSYVGRCSDWTHAGLPSCPQPLCFVYLI